MDHAPIMLQMGACIAKATERHKEAEMSKFGPFGLNKV